MLYQILTEDKNRESIEEILNKRFSGYTVTPAFGYWNGFSESSLTITIVPPRNCSELTAEQVLEETAVAIKKLNNQESVLVLSIPARGIFV